MVGKTAPKKKIGNVGRRKGATVRDVNTYKWVKAMANNFKKEGKIFVPSCIEFMKTGSGKERAPQNPDWYYLRCAAVLRKVYLRPGVGMGALASYFGNNKNNGSMPEHHRIGYKGLIHWAFRSLEGLGLVSKGKEQGRVITKDGRKRSDTIAYKVLTRRGRKSAAKKRKAAAAAPPADK